MGPLLQLPAANSQLIAKATTIFIEGYRTETKTAELERRGRRMATDAQRSLRRGTSTASVPGVM